MSGDSTTSRVVTGIYLVAFQSQREVFIVSAPKNIKATPQTA